MSSSSQHLGASVELVIGVIFDCLFANATHDYSPSYQFSLLFLVDVSLSGGGATGVCRLLTRKVQVSFEQFPLLFALCPLGHLSLIDSRLLYSRPG